MTQLTKVLLVLIVLTLLVLTFFNYLVTSEFRKQVNFVKEAPLKKHVPRYAWTTIANGPEYSKAALILGYSLRKVNTTHELVLLTSDKKTPENLLRFELLLKVWDRIVYVSAPEIKFKKPEEVVDDFKGRVPSFFLKIRVLELTEYDKIGLLGSDMVILKNIDRAFGCPTPCGVFDTWIWDATSHSVAINTDMLVLKPLKSDYEGLLQLISEIPIKELSSLRDEREKWYGPYDQGLFGYYYGTRWSVLAYTIGGIETRPTVSHRPYIWDLKYLHVVHYAQTRPKPWQISNLTHNYAWENSIFRETLQVYVDVEKEFRSTLDEKFRVFYDKLSYIEYRTVCDPDVCKSSKALRESGAEISVSFELDFALKYWTKFRNQFDYFAKTRPTKNFLAKKLLLICQEKVDYYTSALEKLGIDLDRTPS